MKFEKEFPSLKGKVELLSSIINLVGEDSDEAISHLKKCVIEALINDKVVLLDNIQKHCLDKKRVEKIIDKLSRKVKTHKGMYEELLLNTNKLKKELGLIK